MRQIIRRFAIHFVIIINVVLIYRNTTATPDHNPSFDYHSQHHTDNQRTSRFNENEQSQQKIADVLDDKSINNVHIQIFLVTPNKTPTNSNIRTNELRNKEIGSQENPISLEIDLEKGTVDEVSNSRHVSPRINDEGNIATFIQPIDQTNRNSKNGMQSKKFEGLSIEEIEPSKRFKSNSDNVAAIDRNWLRANFDKMSPATLNVSENGFSTSNHINNINSNSSTYRFGNLESSHIVDYSSFFTKTPSMQTTTLVSDFEVVFISPEQIPTTTTISITDNEMLLKQTSDQQSSDATINFNPKIFYEDKHSGTSSTQTVHFLPNTYRISENETDFKKTIFSSTGHNAVSKNILPFEPLLTSTVSLPNATPELLIFTNKKKFDPAHVGIKLLPVFDETSRSSGITLIENITESKINSENQSLYFGPAHPVAFIAVGDREILDEQKSHREASSVLTIPHIAVGEQISEMQETYPSDSAEDETMIMGRQSMIDLLQKQDSINTKRISSQEHTMESAEIAEQTQFKKPFRSGFNSRDGIILPDLTTQGQNISSPEIFLIPEQDFMASQPDYIEPIDSVRTLISSEHAPPSAEFGTKRGKSEILKSELITSQSNTNKIKVSEPIYCDNIATNEGECPIVNDKSDQIRSDILFLLDTSHNITKIYFQQAVKFIMDTVEQFKNIGPDGVQISLVQFTREPVLEFSFRKHNCKPCLLADIGDTEYISDLNSVDNVIHKVVKYGFSKRRGDRDEVPNVLVMVSSGMSSGQFHEALQLLDPNNITVIIVSIKDTNPQLIKQLIRDEHHNLIFNVTAVNNGQLADHLAKHIRTTTKEKLAFFENRIAMEMDQSVQEFTVQCLNDGFNVTFKLLKSFGGTIVVRGKNMTKNCSKIIQAEQFGERIDTREVHFFISFKQCDIEEIISVNPAGLNYSALINIIHDKWLVSDADKGFVLQCYQPQQLHELTNLRINQRPQGDIKIAKILPLNSIPPLCNYTIRADTPNGPIIQYAKLGDTIYHKWECENNHQALDLYGLHIHDCYAKSESKQQQQHIIIDSKGCIADANIVNDVIYSDDKLMAFAYVKVFKLTNSEHLSFHCKISLCIKRADGCEGITPPRCPGTDYKDLLIYHRNRHNTESFLAALTTEEEVRFTVVPSMNVTDSAFSHQTVKELSNTNLLWLMVILIALSAIILLILIRYITRMNSKDEFIASESLKRHKTIDNIDYITSATTFAKFLSNEKRVKKEQNDACRSESLKGKNNDGEIKTEIVSVSLNSTNDGIRPSVKYDSSDGTVSATESRHVQFDQHDGSSWSF
ncbi:von Willebrand factor type A domain containing protein [Brugia malayi]|uniref:von Willebrand factor type A domain containing protein n=1 Tax=Brugia malayi TaxID=6279 RepID=A0A4E9F730_BRUMA|nr:von Willebrand factor type A domain containing protein [Brugia malayi]VIO92100.1 von Willebrand factor type A domain containing protein [Brugia malayi]